MAIINARVWTGTPQREPAPTAIFIRGDRIAIVGGDDQVRAAAVAAHAVVVDAEGRRVIPGITDSHTHFLWAGQRIARLDLRPVRSKEEFVRAVADRAATLAPGAWLLGGEFATEHWPQPERPHRDWIDGVTPGRPAYLTRADLHMALANSAALRLAGITRSGPADPPGGEIDRDPTTGEPTGLVKDAAMELVQRCIPPPDEDELNEALSAACRTANRWGITSVHDMSTDDQIAAYAAYDDRRGLTLRMHSYIQAVDFEAALPLLRSRDAADPILRLCGFKAFVDGSLGSRTALMREPYADARPGDRHPRGLHAKWAADWPVFARRIAWAHAQGVQLAIHAIGDQAVHDLLNEYGSLPDAAARRHRVEHAQHLLPGEAGRFGALGVVASMQPIHKEDDGPWAADAIGPERMQRMYAWRDILSGGGVVCFGSDVPVATNNPFAGLAMATTGRLPDGRACGAAQNLSREQALHAYTAAPPWAVFREGELGTIEPGKLADIAILDRDVLAVADEQLAGTTAWMTLVGGRVVFAVESGPVFA
jgi:predicted amidohydrolase YtcJ